jgi:hypothetical protein
VQWEWGAEQIEALATLKELLCTEGIGLHRPDTAKQFELHTDWSNRGISAVLVQRDDVGKPKLIAAMSRSLNKHESNYTAWKGELLAVTFGMRGYRAYLYGRRFKVATDHRPLLWLLSQK